MCASQQQAAKNYRHYGNSIRIRITLFAGSCSLATLTAWLMLRERSAHSADAHTRYSKLIGRVTMCVLRLKWRSDVWRAGFIGSRCRNFWRRDAGCKFEAARISLYLAKLSLVQGEEAETAKSRAISD